MTARKSLPEKKINATNGVAKKRPTEPLAITIRLNRQARQRVLKNILRGVQEGQSVEKSSNEAAHEALPKVLAKDVQKLFDGDAAFQKRVLGILKDVMANAAFDLFDDYNIFEDLNDEIVNKVANKNRRRRRK